MNSDNDAWLDEYETWPEARCHLNGVLDTVEERLCGTAGYGHKAVARERLKKAFHVMWRCERELLKLVPHDDRYSPGSKKKN